MPFTRTHSVPVSVFLVKATASAINPSSPELSAFDGAGLTVREIELGESRGRFWIGRSDSSPPDWVSHFGPMAGLDPGNFGASSVQGAIAVRVNDAEFLFTFGHAWRRVRSSRVIANFGLRCVLNLCGASGLRAVKHDRIAHDYVQMMVQSPEQANIHRFGIDIEQDLLRGVRAGVDRSHGLGSSIAGSDAFKFNYDPAYSLESLLTKVWRIHRRQDYQKNFRWIDDISPVRDEALAGWLVDELAAELNASGTSAVLCLPDFEGWESYDQYVYGRNVASAVHSTLSLDSWKHHLRGEGIRTITSSTLRDQKIHAQYGGDRSIKRTWPALECIHVVLDTVQGRFLAHGGDWFQLGEGYVERLQAQLRHLVAQLPVGSLPSSRNGEHEGDYNARVVRSSKRQLFLLDKKLVSHGGGRSQIEVCDMLSTSLQLICVKRWCNSAGVSHLCQQALNAARLIRGDNDFVKKADKKLKGVHRAAWKSVQSHATVPEVVLALMGGGELEYLPLFSRMTILATAKQLRSMGFSVSYCQV